MRRAHYQYAWCLLVLLACYGYFVQGLGANELSRYDFVRAVADDGTAHIDRYHENTIDKGYHNGHYYSDKAYGLAVAAMPVYAAVRATDRLAGREARNEFGMIYLLVLGTVALPSALLALLIARASRLLVPQAEPAPMALAYGLGTMAFPFSTMFFGHQTAACLGFAAALVLLSRRRRPSAGGSLPILTAAGLLAGTAVLFEYPTALVAGLLFGYVLLCFPGRREAAAYLAGLAPPLLALATLNYVVFGDPFRLSYTYASAASFPQMADGLLGVSWPDPLVALQLLFAGKGLLVNAPVVALAPLGFWRLWRESATRPEALLCAAVSIVFLAYNAGYFLPFGGATAGPRFLLPALPFAFLPLATVLARPGRARLIARALAVWGVIAMAIATATGPLVSEDEAFPLVSSWVPNLLAGHFVYNVGMWRLGLTGEASLLPLLPALLFGLGAVAGVPRPARGLAVAARLLAGGPARLRSWLVGKRQPA